MKKSWCAGLVLMAVAGVLAGEAAAPSKQITVCLLPKKKGVPYFTTCAKGAEEAAKELGHVRLIYDGPTDGAPEKAASMIEKWTLQGVDVIAVSPNDPEVLAPAMKKARQKGVHVITWDADGLPGTREWLVNQATAQDIGYPRLHERQHRPIQLLTFWMERVTGIEPA